MSIKRQLKIHELNCLGNLRMSWLWMPSALKFYYFTFVVCWKQGWEHVIPKYSNLANNIFSWRNLRNGRYRRVSLTFSITLKESWEPHVRGNLLIPGGKESPYLPRPRDSQDSEQTDFDNFPWGFSGGSVVKNLSAIHETQVRALGREDPLEKEMTAHSSILAWEIPRTEAPGGLQSMGSQRVRHDRATKGLSVSHN